MILIGLFDVVQILSLTRNDSIFHAYLERRRRLSRQGPGFLDLWPGRRRHKSPGILSNEAVNCKKTSCVSALTLLIMTKGMSLPALVGEDFNEYSICEALLPI